MACKFVPLVCGHCGTSLAKEKPGGVELMAKAQPFEEPFPDRYGAKCPSCGDYNLVTSPKVPAPEPEPEPEPETTE